jgi:hypothetical protein
MARRLAVDTPIVEILAFAAMKHPSVKIRSMTINKSIAKQILTMMKYGVRSGESLDDAAVLRGESCIEYNYMTGPVKLWVEQE